MNRAKVQTAATELQAAAAAVNSKKEKRKELSSAPKKWKQAQKMYIKSFPIMYRSWQRAFELHSSIQSNDWFIRFLFNGRHYYQFFFICLTFCVWSVYFYFWALWLICLIFRTKHILLDYFICTYSIILESSYSLYDRAFADNIGTVLFYAVIVSLCSFIFVSPIDSSRASRKDLKWIETTKIKLT